MQRRVPIVAAIGAAAALAVGLATPWEGADAHNGWGHDRGSDKLLFFASDGMRQDAVEQYSKQGATPTFPILYAMTFAFLLGYRVYDRYRKQQQMARA